MQQQCDLIIEGNIGAHGSAGHNQERAAWAAITVMEQYGRPIQPYSSTSVYRTVAALLFQAMTGGQYQDIERACKVAARRVRAATEDRDRNRKRN
jgi:hypothetical protein